LREQPLREPRTDLRGLELSGARGARGRRVQLPAMLLLSRCHFHFSFVPLLLEGFDFDVNDVHHRSCAGACVAKLVLDVRGRFRVDDEVSANLRCVVFKEAEAGAAAPLFPPPHQAGVVTTTESSASV